MIILVYNVGNNIYKGVIYEKNNCINFDGFVLGFARRL